MAKSNSKARHKVRSAATPISGNSPTKETTMAAVLKDEFLRDRQTARGLIPAEGTTDGEDGYYYDATPKERREAIVRLGDLSKAVTVAMGSVYAIHGMGRLLQQDTLRDEEAFVLSIAHMIVEESERLVEFLDRPGGWPQPRPITEELARRAASLGYMLFNDDTGGITIEHEGDPEAQGMIGADVTEAMEFLAQFVKPQ